MTELDQLKAECFQMREALEKISETKDKTLLGKCCPRNECFIHEDVKGCAAQVTAHNAFCQNAEVADSALKLPHTAHLARRLELLERLYAIGWGMNGWGMKDGNKELAKLCKEFDDHEASKP